MDALRFDALSRALWDGATRRAALAVALGSALVVPGPPIGAKKKRKKKLKRNEFGCVNVGGACRGNDAFCCSSICEGKKPKKGKPDRSRCVAHGVGICTQGQNACTQGFDTGTQCSLDNPDCFCITTTGNAGFCGDSVASQCVVCNTDTDCETFGFPPGSACTRPGVEGGCTCSATGGTACYAPCA